MGCEGGKFASILNTLATQMNAEVDLGPLKRYSDALQKVLGRGSDDPKGVQEIYDAVRATLKFPDPRLMKEGVGTLSKSLDELGAGVLPGKKSFKNRVCKPTCGGYMDIKFAMLLKKPGDAPDWVADHTAEVQINTKSMLEAKVKGAKVNAKYSAKAIEGSKTADGYQVYDVADDGSEPTRTNSAHEFYDLFREVGLKNFCHSYNGCRKILGSGFTLAAQHTIMKDHETQQECTTLRDLGKMYNVLERADLYLPEHSESVAEMKRFVFKDGVIAATGSPEDCPAYSPGQFINLPFCKKEINKGKPEGEPEATDCGPGEDHSEDDKCKAVGDLESSGPCVNAGCAYVPAANGARAKCTSKKAKRMSMFKDFKGLNAKMKSGP